MVVLDAIRRIDAAGLLAAAREREDQHKARQKKGRFHEQAQIPLP